jgi:hypothetical protein
MRGERSAVQDDAVMGSVLRSESLRAEMFAVWRDDCHPLQKWSIRMSKPVPGAKAHMGWLFIVRAEARTYLRCNGKGEYRSNGKGKCRSNSKQPQVQRQKQRQKQLRGSFASLRMTTKDGQPQAGRGD